MSLTIAYMTNRKEPHINWFLDSLHNQLRPDDNIKVIVIDFWRDTRDSSFLERSNGIVSHHVSPKPTVWQGPHRKTKNDYFCASNARNTAICLAPDGHIAFVDDLSVLLPTWLEAVRRSVRENYIALGSYKKVKKLNVENGNIVSFEEFPPGVDSRLRQANAEQTSAAGSWLFGCSFCSPIEALLEVNGVDEDCDSTGLGSEDYCLGIRIGSLGRYSFRYDRSMMTYESEEDHGKEPAFLRKSKGPPGPQDKSWAMLHKAQNTKRAGHAFDIRDIRRHVQSGNPFPIPTEPKVDWYDSQPVAEL